MGLSLIVTSGFFLALVAPWLHRVARGMTGWLLAVLPLSHVVYLASHMDGISSGQAYSVSYGWMPSIGLAFSFYLDGLSFLLAFLISGIGTLVLIYSNGYMEGRPHQGRFYAFILMFMASMLGLVLADNILLLYIFWELTSLSSYLLIGFEHETKKVRDSAKQALLLTSGGGLAMLAGLLLLANSGGSFELSVLGRHGHLIQTDAFYLPILLLVLIGAATKSAQVPFHIWLPNAMDAPTPVSAYLHSATMVKAGIYLLARLHPALGGTDLWMGMLTGLGAATMLTGAVLAFPQRDLKKALAYATISVLGMLVLLLGVGSRTAIQAAMLYLLAHALYKGALFFVAGSLDHATGTRQLDRLGGLGRAMPILAGLSILAALSMAGIPPFIGYIAKEFLYETGLKAPDWPGFLTFGFILTSLFFVALALMLGIRPFWGKMTSLPHPLHAPPVGMQLPTTVLAGTGLICGLWPSLVEQSFLAPAAEAVSHHPVEMHLSLWHGWTLKFGLSLLTLALGFALFAFRHSIIRSGVNWLAPAVRWGAAQGYQTGERALHRLAEKQTRLVHHRSLSWYVRVTIATAIVLGGWPLVTRDLQVQSQHWMQLKFHELAMAITIILATGIVVFAYSRLMAITAMGFIGYSMALLFIFFGAPDLAMTQFLVDTLIIILLVLVFPGLPESPRLTSTRSRIRDGVFALLFGTLVCILVLLATSVPISPELAQFYAQHSVSEAHGSNIVNVILVDFRGFDTLGEITVLAMAGIGVFALMKRKLSRERARE